MRLVKQGAIKLKQLCLNYAALNAACKVLLFGVCMSQKFTQAAARFIFWSRWLQLPMYIGLIVALGVYSYKFFIMLSNLVIN